MGNNKQGMASGEIIGFEIKLSDISLLEKVLQKEFVEGYNFKLNITVNNVETLNNIETALLKEFCDKGIDKDHEPNEHGRNIENLISKVNRVLVQENDNLLNSDMCGSNNE